MSHQDIHCTRFESLSTYWQDHLHQAPSALWALAFSSAKWNTSPGDCEDPMWEDMKIAHSRVKHHEEKTCVSVIHTLSVKSNRRTSRTGLNTVNNNFSSVAQSCPTVCDPMDCSTPGSPVYHLLPEPTQTHVHRVSDAIQPSHPLSSLSSAFNLSQHQSLPMSQFFTAGGQSIGASVPLTRIQEIDLRSTAECRTQHYLRGSLSPSGTFHLCSLWSLDQQIQWQEGGSSYSFGKKKKQKNKKTKPKKNKPQNTQE